MDKEFVQENDKFELPEWLLELSADEIKCLKEEFYRELKEKK